MATVLWVDGTRHDGVPKNGRNFTLDELQTLVGGYIEALNAVDGRLMIVNEDGLNLQLPINEQATQLAGQPLPPPGVIVGTALLCTREELGETDDL